MRQRLIERGQMAPGDDSVVVVDALYVHWIRTRFPIWRPDPVLGSTLRRVGGQLPEGLPGVIQCGPRLGTELVGAHGEGAGGVGQAGFGVAGDAGGVDGPDEGAVTAAGNHEAVALELTVGAGDGAGGEVEVCGQRSGIGSPPF